MPAHFIVVCTACGCHFETEPTITTCPKCGSGWLEARYDLQKLGRDYPASLANRPFNLWRYRELLPIREQNREQNMGEGGTPLIHAANLGLMIGCRNVFVKDERQGPTASFKDRQAAVAIAALKQAGIQEMVLASTGNVAIAYSAFAARAGIKVWAFLTSQVPAVKMREVAIYGTQVIKVTGSYDQVKLLAARFAEERNLYFDRGARCIPCTEAMKTMAFEICEQLTAQLGPPSSGAPWRAPEWYVQSVSGGMGPYGVLKGFSELKEMGVIDRIPKIACIQVEGCAPMVHAWKQDRDTAVPVRSPQTLIETLATGDPGPLYTRLRKNILAAEGGAFEFVSDDEAFRAMHYLAKMEGLSVEPASAVAVAGLVKLVRAGQIQTGETVVINATGHTMPVEREVLGEGWSKNLAPSKNIGENPEEGLLAALSKVTLDRYPRIEIVDDTPDARRLVRRILQSQGSFTIHEASNGKEAVQVAREQHPNLIILDLMMPEMDGFAVMDALQADQETADIPVIVVTAKELTPDERDRLDGHIRSLMQKGDFMSDELIDEIHALLG